MTVHFLLANCTTESVIANWLKQIFTLGIKKHGKAFSYFQISLTLFNAFWGMLLCSVRREKLVEQPDEGCNWGRQGTATCSSSPGREPNCLPMSDLILLFVLMWHAESDLHFLNTTSITISHFNLTEITVAHKGVFFSAYFGKQGDKQWMSAGTGQSACRSGWFQVARRHSVVPHLQQVLQTTDREQTGSLARRHPSLPGKE